MSLKYHTIDEDGKMTPEKTMNNDDKLIDSIFHTLCIGNYFVGKSDEFRRVAAKEIIALVRDSEWRSVEDELPRKFNHERTDTVLLWCRQQPNMPYILGYGLMKDGVNYPFEISTWKSLDSGCNIIYGEITHWMTLPSPPKQPQD